MNRKITRLQMLVLEDRFNPALSVNFDYRFDTSGFFNDSARRAMLERAGQDIGNRIETRLSAITPGNGNSWSAIFINPATGTEIELPNVAIGADSITVFVGSHNLDGAEAGEGGSGGYRVGGSSSWLNTIANRGTTGYSIWGGSISFDSDARWHFGEAITLTSTQTDFYTVASHELGHVLGFGTAPKFNEYINGRSFTGPNALAANGGVRPTLSSDLAHWSQGTTSSGQPASLQPYLVNGQRYGLSSLDFAALADIGWTVNSSTVPPVSPKVITPVTSGTLSPISTNSEPIVITGTGDGLARIVRYVNGQLQNDTAAIRPFADYTGVLRSVTADVTGDGVTDIVFATGPGATSRVAVVDGATGYTLITPDTPFGRDFTGGLYLATADFNNDGRDDIIISPDRGGGGRVVVYRYGNNALNRVGDFFGIDDATFRGGARVAAADMNGDGTADLIVGAGFGGGPRIALFDGRSIGETKPRKFIGDFFAFPGEAAGKLRNGVYLAAGDLDKDGKADLVFGAGPGGGPHVYVLSGAKLLAGDLAGAYASPLASYFAFDVNDRGGVRVSLKDVNNDGQLDIVAGSGTSGSIAWFASASPQRANRFDPLGLQSTTDGVYVG